MANPIGAAETVPQVKHGFSIPLMRPVVDEEMLQAALYSLQNEKLVMGESVFKFEEEFALYCGSRYAVSTGSGTAALQIALQSMQIGQDDEVLTTPFSFFATSNAVIHAGAQPRFADVEDNGFNLDPA
jgi:perosamine synthetase